MPAADASVQYRTLDPALIIDTARALERRIEARFPASGLGGNGTPESRAEINRWLAFVNSDVHPAFKPLFGATAYLGDDAVTSGAKADLQHTTRVAREMVYKLGMGATTGLVAFDERATAGDVSGELHAAMDRDVRTLVDALYARVSAGLTRYRSALDALAAELRARETLDGEATIAICAEHGVPVPPGAPRRQAMHFPRTAPV